jgi:predicted aspartyl protease
VSDYSSVLNDAYPGPYVTVRLTSLDSVEQWPGVLDTGSDITIIPSHLVQALNLQPFSDDIDLYDAGGKKTENAYEYHVDIYFEGFNFPDLMVTSTPYPVVLIGRDALNDLIATFDGPAGQFDLVRPSPANP